MTSEWIRAALDVALIGLIGAGLVQASRLLRQLADLRRGRIEMERFVEQFSATVDRAEAGIKGLRQAARESGDDLEKLVEKSVLLRDELQFIVESADQIASRLSTAAAGAMRPSEKPAAVQTAAASETPPAETKPAAVAPLAARKAPPQAATAPASRAEKELMQALEKLG